MRLQADEKEQFNGESVMGSVRDEDARASGSQADEKLAKINDSQKSAAQNSVKFLDNKKPKKGDDGAEANEESKNKK